MIPEFIERWEERKHTLHTKYTLAHPADYEEIVRDVIELLHDEDDLDSPDPDRIHEINDGDYQGYLLYVIGSSSYPPSLYYYVFISYGSCSACDTLQRIQSNSDDSIDPAIPNEQQTKDYMIVALHIVQNLKRIGE